MRTYDSIRGYYFGVKRSTRINDTTSNVVWWNKNAKTTFQEVILIF